MAESNHVAKLLPGRGRRQKSGQASSHHSSHEHSSTSSVWRPREENGKYSLDNLEDRYFVVKTKQPLWSASIPEHWVMLGEIQSRFVLSSGMDSSPTLLGISEKTFIELLSVDDEISRNDEALDVNDAETDNMDDMEIHENVTDVEKDIGFLTVESVLGETNGPQIVTTTSLRKLVSTTEDVYVIYPCEEEPDANSEKTEKTATVSTTLNEPAQKLSTGPDGSRETTKIELVRAGDLDSQIDDGLVHSGDDDDNNDDGMHDDDGKIDDDDDTEADVIDASALPVLDASEMEVLQTVPQQNNGDGESTVVLDPSDVNASTSMDGGDVNASTSMDGGDVNASTSMDGGDVNASTSMDCGDVNASTSMDGGGVNASTSMDGGDVNASTSMDGGAVQIPGAEPLLDSEFKNRSSRESSSEFMQEELRTRKLSKRKDKSIVKPRAEKPSSYPCPICSKVFRDRGILRKHRVLHENKREHVCEICGRGFHFRWLLASHIRKIHERAEEQTCDICGLTFMTLSSYKNHVMMHSGERPHMCELCGKGFSQKGALKSHQTVVHSDERNHMCSVCGKSYKKANALVRHMRDKHSPEGSTPKVCETCGKSYASVDGLEQHRRYQRHGPLLDSQTFACDVCGRDYATFQGMQIHKRSHERRPDPCQESLECEVCGKKTANMTALKSHRRIHYKERKKVCEICGKKFMSTGNLKTHMRIHTGEKPYECSKCYKRFIQVSGLNIHGLYCKARHPVKQTFTCSVCDRVFRRFVNLCKHLVSVHDLEAPVDANPGPGFSSAFAANAALNTIVAGN